MRLLGDKPFADISPEDIDQALATLPGERHEIGTLGAALLWHRVFAGVEAQPRDGVAITGETGFTVEALDDAELVMVDAG